MDCNRFSEIDLSQIPTPCYLVDEIALERNLKILQKVQSESDGKVLLALKAFAMFSLFPMMREFLHGVCASSAFEARLGKEEFGKQVQTYGPAYSSTDIEQIIKYSDHIIFNSENQWLRHRNAIPESVKCGFRVNPEYSEIDIDLYDPCGTNSRLGMTLDSFPKNLDGITGLHFHALCEQNADTLNRVINKVEEKFGHILKQMKWINLGGGHHITRQDYDLPLLIQSIRHLIEKYNLEVYLEPGEAVALNTGVLVSSVLDIVNNGMEIAILDTSAEAHMPDVIAMPYRPDIIGAAQPGEYPHAYRLAGMTCLAGDVIGDYSFPHKLQIGDKLVFLDMAHYTMVKNNMFNGINLPSIVVLTKENKLKVIRQFSYSDYKSRLS